MGRVKHNQGLTEREIQVLVLIAEGKTTLEIAEVLGVSRSTVIAHTAHIHLKLDLYNKAELTKYALKHNLTTLEQ